MRFLGRIQHYGGSMNISVKFKALLLVSTMVLVSLGGYVLLLLNMSAMEQEYNEQTKTAVEQSIRTEAEKINTYMALVQVAPLPLP